MIRLDTTTTFLQAVLAGAVATTQPTATVFYSDDNGTTYPGAKQLTTLNGVTDVDICDAPAVGVVRDIDYLSIINADTAPISLTIKIDIGGVDSIIIQTVLQTLETIVYTHSNGWECLDAQGRIKTGAQFSGVLPVASGGTGSTTLTPHGILIGEGTSPVVATAAMADGQLLVGQTGNDPLPKTVSGDATINAAGALTINTIGGVIPGQPNFSVYLNVNQNIPAPFTPTKISFDTENFDSGGYFDTGLSRFTPLVAGIYIITVAAYLSATAGSPLLANVAIYKNSAEVFRNGADANAATGIIQITGIVFLNGSTDFVEGFARINGTAPFTLLGGSTLTYMFGYRIGP